MEYLIAESYGVDLTADRCGDSQHGLGPPLDTLFDSSKARGSQDGTSGMPKGATDGHQQLENTSQELCMHAVTCRSVT